MLNIRMNSRPLIFKLLLAVIMALSLLGCVTHDKKNSRLEYISGNESFVLKKECITQVSLPQYGYAKLDDGFTGIFVKVKNNAMCSGKLNSFISKNIGNDLYLKFDDKHMMKRTKIVSNIRTEVGYYQGIFNKNSVEDILKSYN